MPRGCPFDGDKERVLELYVEQRLTIAQVQQATGYGRAAVIAVLQEAGVTRYAKRPEQVLPDDEKHSWRRIARDHQQKGVAVPALARQYNVGEDYVRFCLRRAGFPERTE